MGTMTGYNPRQHAQEVAQGNELAFQLLRELALQRCLLERVLQAVTANARETDHHALDVLIDAAAAALGDRTWSVAELMARAIASDQAAYQLLAALAVADCKLSAKSLGRFLAARVAPGASRVTAAGNELQRNESREGNVVLWQVKSV